MPWRARGLASVGIAGLNPLARAPHVADRRRRLRHRSQVDLTLLGLQCATRRRCDK